MWLTSTEQDCQKFDPANCGWLLNQNYELNWFEGDPTPMNAEDIILDDSSETLDLLSDGSTSDED